MVILWAPAGDFKTQSWSAYKNWTEPPVPRTSVNPQKESRTVLLVSKRNKRVDTKYNCQLDLSTKLCPMGWFQTDTVLVLAVVPFWSLRTSSHLYQVGVLVEGTKLGEDVTLPRKQRFSFGTRLKPTWPPNIWFTLRTTAHSFPPR